MFAAVFRRDVLIVRRPLNFWAFRSAASGAGAGATKRMPGMMLPQELRLNGITTMEQANRVLADVYLPEHNRRFAVEAQESGEAFVPWAGPGRYPLSPGGSHRRQGQHRALQGSDAADPGRLNPLGALGLWTSGKPLRALPLVHRPNSSGQLVCYTSGSNA